MEFKCTSEGASVVLMDSGLVLHVTCRLAVSNLWEIKKGEAK